MALGLLAKNGLYQFTSRAQVADSMRRVPGIENAYKKIFYSRHGRDNWFCGHFTSYASAAAAVQADRASGWDNEASAKHYIDPSQQPSSYAVLVWLLKTIDPNSCVVDIGGGVGQMYHRFRKYSSLDSVKWHVVEVPAAVELGRQRALNEGTFSHLSFGTELSQAPDCDILHSAGCLQYMNNAVPWVLSSMPNRPRWIIINKVMLTDKDTFWTLQNFSSGVAPYQVYNSKEFISYFESRGYAMIDSWDARELSVKIPFHPRNFIPSGAGFCFELQLCAT
jgi:putative methyltransferase (TIGR04325 family)